MRAFISAFIAAVSFAQAANAEQIWVTMDQVRPYDVSKPAGEIIIGNAGIADVTVQDKQRLLFFGKAPGTTNIIIYDEEGNAIDNLIVKVRTSSELLTFQRGQVRTSYNCTTHCEPTVTIGDDNAGFSETITQIQQKFDQATANSGD